jgi:2-furoyl-CoA dehydrogenase large subunit
VWSNFQGPFVLQPLMAGALKVPGNRLRLITPHYSGGSFGIKQAVLSSIVLLAAASRALKRPIKWIEDRAEHLTAASASSDRTGKVAAASLR